MSGRTSTSIRALATAAVLAAAIGIGPVAGGAQPPAAGAPETSEELIRLSFPENVEIKLLVEYVSARLGINILYDEQVGAKKLTIKAPAAVPKDSLLGLLDSALKMKSLMLIDAEQPGWKKIVQVKDLAEVAPVIGEAPSAAQAAQAVTQVFSLRHVPPQAVMPVIKPFLTSPGGNSFEIAAQRLLVVTDYGHNLPRIAKFIELLDVPGPQVELTFVPVAHLEATAAASEVTRLLGEKRRAAADGDRSAARAVGVTVSADARTNRLVFIGPADETAEALAVLKELDVPLGVETKVYQFATVSADRVDRLARELTDPTIIKNRFRSSVDREAGLLIVTAPPEVHAQIERIREDLDRIPEAQASPIRIYKLLNTTAGEVLATIQQLIARQGGLTTAVAAVAPADGAAPESPRPADMPGPNLPPAGPGQPLPKPPAYRESAQAPATQPAALPAPASIQTIAAENATVTADVNTNSIIVMAPPSVQRVYENLIRLLDKRRPQVLIEFTIVTLDTSDGYSLGVEISSQGTFGDDNSYLTFSAFGLSTIDLATGGLTLKPGTGFNGVVLSPDVANIVIKALASDSRSKVVSSPRILVNDNASGTLDSVAQAPFTSVNASDTVATTSFAGYADAGTTLTVTPHIGEGDHLNLQYSVTLSSFTGDGSETVPPPRQTNTIDSEVTIPDGHTVVVGGLSREDFTRSVARVPGLGNLPWVEYFFSNRSKNTVRSTLFVFIRPVVLRDDQFEDLKYYSQRDLRLAGLPEAYPESGPLLID